MRTIHPVIPPCVEYKQTKLGPSLGEAVCGVWVWAAKHLEEIENAHRAFDANATAKTETRKWNRRIMVGREN